MTPTQQSAGLVERLLPCPFCGGAPEIDADLSRTTIRCPNDQCIIWTPTPAPFNDYTHKADATAAWNRRAEPPEPAPIASDAAGGLTRAQVVRDILYRDMGGETAIGKTAGDILAALDALSLPPVHAGEASMREVIWQALSDYTLTNMRDGEGNDFPLVDLMSNDGKGIDTGEAEMRVLADRIGEALESGTRQTVDISHLSPEQQADIRAHVTGLSEPETEFYDAPEHGWTCFHCGQTFKTIEGAELHFGEDVKGRPICFTPSSGKDVDGLREKARTALHRVLPNLDAQAVTVATDAILAALSNRRKS